MLVTFNIPAPDPGHADHAVAAAISILDTVERREFGGHRLRVRVGVNTGLVFAGNVGAGDRYNYTVHGDAVNLAALLEELNKDLDTRLLVSSNTTKLLTREFPLAPLRQDAIPSQYGNLTLYTLATGEHFDQARNDAALDSPLPNKR